MPITFGQRGRAYLGASLAIAMRPRDNWQQKRADKERQLVYQTALASQLEQQANARDLQVQQMEETLSTVSKLGFLKKDQESLQSWNKQKQDELKTHISTKYGGDVNKFLAIEGDRWKAAYIRELSNNPQYSIGLKNKTNYGLYQDAQTKSGVIIRPVQYNRMNEETGKMELVMGTVEQNLIDYQSGKTKEIGWNATFDAPKDAKKFFNTTEAPDRAKEVTPNDLIQYGLSAGLNQQDATLWASQAMQNEKWLWKDGEWDRNFKLAQFQQKVENDNRNAAMRQQQIKLQRENTEISRKKLQVLEDSLKTQDPLPYIEGVDALDQNKAQTVVTAAGQSTKYWLPTGQTQRDYAFTRFAVTDVKQDGDEAPKKMLPLAGGQSFYIEEEINGQKVMKEYKYSPKDAYKYFGNGAIAGNGAGVYIAPTANRYHIQSQVSVPVPFGMKDEYENVTAKEDYIAFTSEKGKTFYLPYESKGIGATVDARKLAGTKAQREAMQDVQESNDFSNWDQVFGIE
jgi:hypothetical protein